MGLVLDHKALWRRVLPAGACGLSTLHAHSLRVTELSSLLCSESHESHPHGCSHSLTPQRLQWEWMWGRGLLAGGRPAGCDPYQWLCGTGNQTTSHGIRDLQNGTGHPRPLSVVQWPEAQWRIQSRQAWEESHILPDAPSPVCFLCAPAWGLPRGPQGSTLWEPGPYEERLSLVLYCVRLPFDSATLECAQIEIFLKLYFSIQVSLQFKFFFPCEKRGQFFRCTWVLENCQALSPPPRPFLPAWVRSSTIWSLCFELNPVRSLAWVSSQ